MRGEMNAMAGVRMSPAALTTAVRTQGATRAATAPLALRRFASSSSSAATSQSTMDLIRKVSEEIQEEEDNENEGMSEDLTASLETSIFKVVSDEEDKNIVKLQAETKDCLIKVSFNAVDLIVELSTGEAEEGNQEEESGAAEAVESTVIPVEIEITPISQVSSPSATRLRVVGKVTRSTTEEDPYMTPEKVTVVSPPADDYSPVIGELDAGLQDAISEWIADRNVDSDLFHLIIDYAIYKEGKTYLRWLRQIKSFVNTVEPSTAAARRR